MSGQEHFDRLNAWCKETGLLHLRVSFDDDRFKVMVRVKGFEKGRTLVGSSGQVLDEVCAELLLKAVKIHAVQAPSIIRQQEAEIAKRERRRAGRITRDIEAMHGY